MSSFPADAAQNPSEVDPKIAFKKITADLWSAAADEYSANLLKKPTGSVPHLEMQLGRELIVTRVVTFLAGKENPVVLDVAAAGGEPSLSMAKEMPHATIYGTDIAPGMVDMMRKRCEEVGVTNLEPRVEDGQALSSFDDDSVDVVTCTWGLESMPEHEKAIEQFHRVLKPGGMAIFAVWDKDPNSIMLKVMRVMSTLGHAIPLSTQALGGDIGLKAMKSAGFTEVKATPVPIPLNAPSSFELRDLFPFIVKPTPINGILSVLEEKGRTDVRKEACTIFQSEVLEDIAQGHAPTGPGLGRANEADPAFYMNALVVEGHRKGNM